MMTKWTKRPESQAIPLQLLYSSVMLVIDVDIQCMQVMHLSVVNINSVFQASVKVCLDIIAVCVLRLECDHEFTFP